MRSPNEDILRNKPQSQQPVLADQKSGTSCNNNQRAPSAQSSPNHKIPAYLIDEREWIRQFGY
jgi:hypothetical protein